MWNERELTGAEQAVLDRAEGIPPSEWQVTGQQWQPGGFCIELLLTLEARTAKGVRFVVSVQRVLAGTLAYYLHAETPSGSSVDLMHGEYTSYPKVPRAKALYEKLARHFVPIIVRQQMEDEKEKGQEFLRHL